MQLRPYKTRQQEATAILQSLRAAEPHDGALAASRLLPLVYDELRDLARGLLAFQGRDQTIQPTALVHEAFVRLVRQDNPSWSTKEHFFNVAAMAMRQLLCDYARRRRAGKRGGDWARVSLDEAVASDLTSTLDLLALDDALSRLAADSPRQARIAELRFLAGLSVEETARVLSVSTRTVESDWRFARAWLRRELEKGTG